MPLAQDLLHPDVNLPKTMEADKNKGIVLGNKWAKCNGVEINLNLNKSIFFLRLYKFFLLY
jgi:hypothetical protein